MTKLALTLLGDYLTGVPVGSDLGGVGVGNDGK